MEEPKFFSVLSRTLFEFLRNASSSWRSSWLSNRTSKARSSSSGSRGSMVLDPDTTAVSSRGASWDWAAVLDALDAAASVRGAGAPGRCVTPFRLRRRRASARGLLLLLLGCRDCQRPGTSVILGCAERPHLQLETADVAVSDDKCLALLQRVGLTRCESEAVNIGSVGGAQVCNEAAPLPFVGEQLQVSGTNRAYVNLQVALFPSSNREHFRRTTGQGESTRRCECLSLGAQVVRGSISTRQQRERIFTQNRVLCDCRFSRGAGQREASARLAGSPVRAQPARGAKAATPALQPHGPRPTRLGRNATTDAGIGLHQACAISRRASGGLSAAELSAAERAPGPLLYTRFSPRARCAAGVSGAVIRAGLLRRARRQRACARARVSACACVCRCRWRSLPRRARSSCSCLLAQRRGEIW
eukprot:scaffold338_cov377-Prasinococcus_capsulatus_cf.AAC.8